VKNSEYKYAGFWIRVGASLIDMFLMALVITPIVIWFYGFNIITYNDNIALDVIDGILNYVLPFIVTILFWFYKSATPGKLFLHMKIVDAKSGKKMNIKQSLIRYFAYLPSILIFMLGILWVAYDRKKQGWHDKIASTVVLVKKKPSDDVSFDDEKEMPQINNT